MDPILNQSFSGGIFFGGRDSATAVWKFEDWRNDQLGFTGPTDILLPGWCNKSVGLLYVCHHCCIQDVTGTDGTDYMCFIVASFFRFPTFLSFLAPPSSPRNRIPTSSSSMLPRASSPGRSEGLPSGKHTKNYRKSPFFRGRSTIKMAMFNSKLLVYQRAPLDTLKMEPEKRCLGIRSLCHSNLSGSPPRGSSLATQNVRSTFRATSNLHSGGDGRWAKDFS